jgi:RNA polymerase sigma-70 factor (ECF subfamily)
LDELFRRARERDPDALGALVEAYGPRVFGLLYRLTGSRDVAEDLLQETFLRLVRNIGRYEHSGRFEAWLFRIAANLARDHVRRTRRRGPTATLDAAPDDEAVPAEVADASRRGSDRRMIDEEDQRRLDACLEELADADREIIMLRHFSGLSFRQIADMLDIPLGTALARAHRALNRLRAAFGDEEPT